MASSTLEAFKEFGQKIRPTSAQMDTVRTKRTATHDYLLEGFGQDSDMPLLRTDIIGSASRGTLIRPLDDIDVMAVFSDENDVYEDSYANDSHAFISRIRDVLGENFTDTIVGTRGQAVRLFYKTGPHVDIAPVFQSNGGGYFLPDGSGGWITTDPDAQATWFNEQDERLGSHLKHLVRILKRWNNEHSKHFHSYHLEVMVAEAFTSLNGNSREAMTKFFEVAQWSLDADDPAGHSGNLALYLTRDERASLVRRLQSAHERAANALDAENNGDHEEAIRLWRIELGDEFPAYS